LKEPDPEHVALIFSTENPFGVHAHDVLSGRGAYVNGHVCGECMHDCDHGPEREKKTLMREMIPKQENERRKLLISFINNDHLWDGF